MTRYRTLRRAAAADGLGIIEWLDNGSGVGAIASLVKKAMLSLVVTAFSSDDEKRPTTLKPGYKIGLCKEHYLR